MIIYLITNTVNGKKYVGQHCGDSTKRWKEHLSSALNCRKNCIKTCTNYPNSVENCVGSSDYLKNSPSCTYINQNLANRSN